MAFHSIYWTTLMDSDLVSFSHHPKLDVPGIDGSICPHHKDKSNTGIGWEGNLDSRTLGCL